MAGTILILLSLKMSCAGDFKRQSMYLPLELLEMVDAYSGLADEDILQTAAI